MNIINKNGFVKFSHVDDSVLTGLEVQPKTCYVGGSGFGMEESIVESADDQKGSKASITLVQIF